MNTPVRTPSLDVGGQLEDEARHPHHRRGDREDQLAALAERAAVVVFARGRGRDRRGRPPDPGTPTPCWSSTSRSRCSSSAVRSNSTRTSPGVTSASTTPSRRRSASATVRALRMWLIPVTVHSTCRNCSVNVAPGRLGQAADAGHVRRRRVVVQAQPRRRAVGGVDHVDLVQARRAAQRRGQPRHALIAPVERIGQQHRQIEHQLLAHRRHPVTDVLDAHVEQQPHVRVVEAVEHLATRTPMPHDPGRPQQPQRVRHRRLRHLDHRGEVADAQLARLQQRAQHLHPTGIAQQRCVVADEDPGSGGSDAIGLDDSNRTNIGTRHRFEVAIMNDDRQRGLYESTTDEVYR